MPFVGTYAVQACLALHPNFSLQVPMHPEIAPLFLIFLALYVKKLSTWCLETNTMTKKFSEGEDHRWINGGGGHSPLLLPICAKCTPRHNLW